MKIAINPRSSNPPWGYFTYTIGDDHWSWSDGTYALLGLSPAEIPGPPGGLRPPHRAVVDGACEAIQESVLTASPFTSRHLLIDRHGRTRTVISVGRAPTSGGGVQQLIGFLVDVTDVQRITTSSGTDGGGPLVVGNRDVIEQVKSMVMSATGCRPDAALAVLADDSRRVNNQLDKIARERVGATRDLHAGPVQGVRAVIEKVWRGATARPA